MENNIGFRRFNTPKDVEARWRPNDDHQPSVEESLFQSAMRAYTQIKNDKA